MEVASIRVDTSLLQESQGKLVRIIGKLESYDPSSSAATLIAGSPIQLQLTENDSLQVGKIYEVIGKVSTSNLTVNTYSVTQLSDNTNLDVAAKLVKYVHKVPELFY